MPLIVENGRVVGHMCLGGPVYEIVVNGKVCAFEMHSYCGPMPVTPKRHDPIDRDPGRAFWDAVDRWKAGGKRLDGVRCVVPQWCVKCRGSGLETYREEGDRRTFARPCPRCDGEKLEPAE